MRRLGYLVPVALVAAVLSASNAIAQPENPVWQRPPPAVAPAPGEPMPTIQNAPRLDGTEISVDYGSHDLTIVHFWATASAASRIQLPALQSLREEFPRDRLEVVGVLQEQIDPAEALAFVEAEGITYPQIALDVSVVRAWGSLRIVPVTFLVAPDGTLVRRYAGASPPEVDGLVRDVRDFLAGRPLKAMVLPAPPAPPPAR